MVSFLEDNGGSPRNADENYIEAYVPVPLLGQVAEQSGVLRVREIIPPQQTGPAATGGGEDIEITLPEKTELEYPNLGSRLDQLVAGVEDGEASTRGAAEDAPVGQEESVAVTIYLSENVDGVVSFLEDNGGSPRNVGEDYIEAYVPVTLLGQVSEQPGVLRVREIIPPQQTGPAATGDGEDIEITLPEKTELEYPNLGSRLDQLVAEAEDGEASTRGAAEDAPVGQEESVAVTIYLSGNMDGVVSFLEDNGGSPRNADEDYIEAYVPVPLLGQVAEQSGVLRVREIIPPQQTGPAATGDGEEIEITLPEKTELKYPNLGSRLDQLVAGVEDGEASTRGAAEDAPVHQEESVAVTIYLSGNVDGVISFLEDNGGSPRNVGEDYIEAYVPVTLLGQLSEQPGVLRVREIVPPQPAQSTQRVAGQGPPVHGSLAWNQAGYSGQGVKVGVIDLFGSFNDFSNLMGTELPSTVQARCYTDVGRFTQTLADCANAVVGNDHGTRVAEAVMDIAPEASLYIASPWSTGDTNSTVDWMVSQGVSVIVRGVTSSFDGPGDGTSPFGDSPLRTVDRAVAGGIIWANAAGNEAQQTWFGPYSIVESGDSRFLKFDGSDIFNDMLLEAGDLITVQLRWDDSWSGASRDFNLFIWDFAAADIVAFSFDIQVGEPGQVPYEKLRYQVPSGGRYARRGGSRERRHTRLASGNSLGC